MVKTEVVTKSIVLWGAASLGFLAGIYFRSGIVKSVDIFFLLLLWPILLDYIYVLTILRRIRPRLAQKVAFFPLAYTFFSIVLEVRMSFKSQLLLFSVFLIAVNLVALFGSKKLDR